MAASDEAVLEPLYVLCREACLSEVERWIQPGKPLQHADPSVYKRKRPPSTIQIAAGQGNHALVHLLLCNGYDPNLERECLLDLALETRRSDLVELLLTWAADPHRVETMKLFDTNDSGLFKRF